MALNFPVESDRFTILMNRIRDAAAQYPTDTTPGAFAIGSRRFEEVQFQLVSLAHVAASSSFCPVV